MVQVVGTPTYLKFCQNVGVSGSTPCVVRQTGEEFEARMGIALLGDTQMSEDEFKKCDYNPFHDDFNDNFVSGKGDTEQEAIEAMKLDLKKMTDMLWS